jgi:sulfite exporter TauE/SafE
MTDAIPILAGTAALIGVGHTLCGPDHYLPFIAMSKARKWSLSRTLSITFLCGIGHVLGSIALGLIGATLGVALGKLQFFEAWRGNLAAQALTILGFTYCVWGIHRAIKNKPHSHPPTNNLTPWVLFAIFVLGPCEALIPLIMYPAAEHSISGMLLVAGIFAVSTIGTMLSVVFVAVWSTGFVKLHAAERFSHAFAGAAICFSGLAIQFLGL